MTSLSSTGPGYRTQLMDRPAADRFARCLEANARFTGVRVLESGRTRNPVRRWYVAFALASQARALEILARFQDDRINRAHAEAGNYLVIHQGHGRYYVVNLAKQGKTYQTCLAPASCGCGDWEHRCQGTAVLCKHFEVIEIHRARGWIEESESPIGDSPLPDVIERPAPTPVLVSAMADTSREEATRRRELLALWD